MPAEDAVQETLLAALAGEDGFGRRSNLRTWLTGILKHKIIDAIRRLSRETPVAAAEDGELDALFDSRGHWIEMPAAWDDPNASLEQKQFFSVLEDCLGRLPVKTAQAFMMREHLGYKTGEICKNEIAFLQGGYEPRFPGARPPPRARRAGGAAPASSDLRRLHELQQAGGIS
jgi:RNA polymerase sigma-70 factor, ECF subfamily